MYVCKFRLSSGPVLFSGKIILAYGLLDGPISITTCLPFFGFFHLNPFPQVLYNFDLNIVWFCQTVNKKANTGILCGKQPRCELIYD